MKTWLHHGGESLRNAAFLILPMGAWGCVADGSRAGAGWRGQKRGRKRVFWPQILISCRLESVFRGLK